MINNSYINNNSIQKLPKEFIFIIDPQPKPSSTQEQKKPDVDQITFDSIVADLMKNPGTHYQLRFERNTQKFNWFLSWDKGIYCWDSVVTKYGAPPLTLEQFLLAYKSVVAVYTPVWFKSLAQVQQEQVAEQKKLKREELVKRISLELSRHLKDEVVECDAEEELFVITNKTTGKQRRTNSLGYYESRNNECDVQNSLLDLEKLQAEMSQMEYRLACQLSHYIIRKELLQSKDSK